MVAHSHLSLRALFGLRVRGGYFFFILAEGNDFPLKSSMADGLHVCLSCINLKPAKTADLSVSILHPLLVLVIPYSLGSQLT